MRGQDLASQSACWFSRLFRGIEKLTTERIKVGRCVVRMELRRTKFVKMLGWVSVRLNGGLPKEPQNIAPKYFPYAGLIARRIYVK